ncbi:PAS domain S-box protein [Pedobacter nyackensis]|uniref:PAS domain-containing sensor histidine kinase n=1 Tax=Pedobacter nyackensis TaxID=475255 RepID=UPI002931B30B|nr:PAS domain S-box protein [Pedobacter nyackensis]
MDKLKNDFYQLIKMNENLLDFIFEAAPKGLCYCQLGEDKQVWVNPEWKQALGYSPQHEFMSIEDILNKECLNHIVNNLSGKRFDPTAEYTVYYRRHNGEIIKTFCTGVIYNGKEGTAPCLFIAIKQLSPMEGSHGHANDVAIENTQLNEKLRISEERFRRAFDHAAIGMAIVGLQGNWMRINRSIFNILGYKPSELLRLTFQDITHPEDLDKDLHLLNEVIQGTRDSYQMEKRYLHKNGHIVWVILAVSIVKSSEGKPLHFISQLTDISKAKEAESEMKSVLEVTSDQNRRLLNFAHIVSHNLRSHSGNLSMLLNFIETDVDEQSRQELFKMFRHAAANLQETIGHLNEVVAVNTTISENLIKVNLNKAINGAIGNIEALLKAADAVCLNEVKDNVLIDAIPAYLDSILLNFLTNAIKYRSKERKPVIHLLTETQAELVVLTIQDNGIGIDLQANRDKIFGMYKTFHTNKDARGIGLFITKNQIEAMGGRVSVESEVDKGTIFKIYFKSQK